MSTAPDTPNPAPRRRFLPSRFRLTGWLAAAIGALMVVFAMPTTGLALPVLVALVPVLIAARDRSWGQRFRLGWLMGFLYHLVLFRWIPFTVSEMTPLPLPATWAMWWAYALWHGLQTGLFLALAEPVRRLCAHRAPALSALAVACVYIAIEAIFPTMFPWSLGHAFWRAGPVAALQAIGGVPLLAFFVVALQAALADALTGAVKSARVAALTCLGLVLLGSGWYIYLTNATPDRVLRIAIVQPNFTLAEKKKANMAQRAVLLNRLDTMLRALPPDRYDLIVGAEGSFPMYWRLDALTSTSANPSVLATRQIAKTIAEGPKTDVILGGLRQAPRDVHSAPGAPPADDKPGKDPIYNAAVHLGPDGHIVDHYDKRVLVPFSEYVPFSDLIPSLRGAIPGVGDFARGDSPCRFEVAGTHLACGICYETMFQDETREAAGDDARLLLNLTIDTWFGKTVAPEMHLMAHASRAVELGLPLVRATLTGISAVVLPTGEVIASLPIDAQDVLSVDVPITASGTTPFRVTGPVVPWLAVAVTLVALALAFRTRKELFPPDGVRPSRERCSSSSAEPSCLASLASQPPTSGLSTPNASRSPDEEA